MLIGRDWQRARSRPRRARGYPTALSTLPPAVTGFAATSTKAMTQGAVPLFTQLWMVPRCTSTSPALRCTLVLFELHVDLA